VQLQDMQNTEVPCMFYSFIIVKTSES